MESLIWLDEKTPAILRLDENLITWNTKSKIIRYPWEDVIGSKLSISLKILYIMAFNRLKNKFKLYKLKHQDSEKYFEIVKKINSYACIANRKFAVFLNPISGNKKSLKIYHDHLSSILEYCQTDHTLFEISSPKYFKSLDRDSLSTFTDIICIGGDGTLHQLLSVLYKPTNLIPNFNFAIVPTGSQNALACELYGKELTSALFSIAKGKPVACDLLKVALEEKELLANTAVSWGLISDITEEAQQYRIFGSLRYGIIAFLRFFQTWKPYKCEILTEKKNQIAKYACVLVGAHSVKSASGDEIVFPNGNICDGKLEIVTMKFASRCKTVKMFNAMRKNGEHVKNKRVEYWKGNNITIKANNHFVWNVDGEIYYSEQAEIEIWKGAIRYLIA